ncbi:response regulator [Nodosilinea nodulosa]|uniref:response regulator n=1 Tax=Nodosilinea nodulosa TaxID=416001 RepID=UPI0018C1FD42|nr:response regulator [Nodosilinea nodulosa]
MVDNDFDSRYLCETLFESHGAKVLTAEFIADALTLLDHFLPDILICEIRFLDEDIRLLIRRARAIALGQNRIIPILVASAYCSASFAQDLIEDMESHLSKPIDIDALVDEVWNLVHLSQALCQTNIQGWVANHRLWKKPASWSSQTIFEKNLA